MEDSTVPGWSEKKDRKVLASLNRQIQSLTNEAAMMQQRPTLGQMVVQKNEIEARLAAAQTPTDNGNLGMGPDAPVVSLGQGTSKVEYRKCMGCGTLTTGSTGAAGIFWPALCQPCKDRADEALERSIAGIRSAFEFLGGAIKQPAPPVRPREDPRENPLAGCREKAERPNVQQDRVDCDWRVSCRP